jgi:hypothetical protein
MNELSSHHSPGPRLSAWIVTVMLAMMVVPAAQVNKFIELLTVPLVGSSSRFSSRRREVFPDPLGPKMASVSPPRKSKAAPATRTFPGMLRPRTLKTSFPDELQLGLAQATVAALAALRRSAVVIPGCCCWCR